MTAIPSARYCKYLTAHAILFSWIDEHGEEAERLHVLEEQIAGMKYKTRNEAEFVAGRFNDWTRSRAAEGADLSTRVVEQLVAHADRDRIPWRWLHARA